MIKNSSETPPPETPPTDTPPPPPFSSGGLEPNVAAALSYLWITAIVFLVVEPFNKDPFVRFHSFQSLFFGIASLVVSIVLAMIPILGWIALIFLPFVILVIWIILVVKAYQKEWFKLPIIGDFAEKQAKGV